MNLTEKEKKYCEYVFLEQAKTVRVGLLIGLSIPVLFGWSIAICAYISGMAFETGFFGVTSLFMTILFAFLYIFKCNSYKNMYKDLCKNNYIVLGKVPLIKKDILKRTHGFKRKRGGMGTPYFVCKEIEGYVLPLSVDLFNEAQIGDMVTVVLFRSYSVKQGIVYSENFDRKIEEWEKSGKQ